MGTINIRDHPRFQNVHITGPSGKFKLYTKNSVPGRSVYGERIDYSKGEEYRRWDPYRSKLAAIILKDPSTSFLSKDQNCLYLGASSGTTVSHLSDILENGYIFSVEFAERSIRQLLQNTAARENVIPILGDARFPSTYAKSIFLNIDLIYQDVAQPNQAEIAVANCNYYLKQDGILILVIKSQSIDSVAKSEKVYKLQKDHLANSGYEVIESINIHDYASNHIAMIAKKKAI